MTEPTARRRPGGRSARVRQAVLEATAQVVAEGGVEAVRVGEIARQAGVHDSSIYRRWPTKEHLVFDALVEYNRDRLPIPDTGSLRADLVGYLATVAEFAATPVGRTIVKAMVGTQDDEAMAAGRAQFWQNRIDRTRVMIDRAVARGELSADTDAAAALELLVGALYFRLLLTRQPIDDDVTGHLVDVLVNGLTR
jgi:AcrR family transcriptional regulator